MFATRIRPPNVILTVDAGVNIAAVLKRSIAVIPRFFNGSQQMLTHVYRKLIKHAACLPVLGGINVKAFLTSAMRTHRRQDFHAVGANEMHDPSGG